MTNKAAKHIVVYEEPHVFWGHNLDYENLESLKSIDADYFRYHADLHVEQLTTDAAQHAAIALRTVYSQAVEALFALVGAFIQAPHFALGWLLKYRDEQLRALVRKIDAAEPIYHRILAGPPTWSLLAQTILENVDWDGVDRERYITGFADLFQWTARDLLSEDRQREYNSIKHGIRQRSGGFSLAIRIHSSNNQGDYRRLGGGRFGSRFYIAPKVKRSSKYHSLLGTVSLNWEPDAIAARIPEVRCVFERARIIEGAVPRLEAKPTVDIPVQLSTREEILDGYPGGPGSL